jgi:AraC-like DNA-binding protein
MHYKRYQPAEAHKHLINFYWEYENDFHDSTIYEQPVTASINPKLAFQYRGKMEMRTNAGNRHCIFSSGFQGQTDTFSTLFANAPMGVFGIYFYPMAIPILFGVPAMEISNYNIEISDFLGLEGKQLEESIMLSKTTTERIKIIANFIDNKIRPLTLAEQSISLLTQHIMANSGLLKTRELAAQLYLCPKQTERKFYQYTGFSPKQFSRIVRFEKSILAMYSRGDKLSSVAHELGYYDQSHFIKDFKEFSGKNPTAYFSDDLSVFLDL